MARPSLPWSPPIRAAKRGLATAASAPPAGCAGPTAGEGWRGAAGSWAPGLPSSAKSTAIRAAKGGTKRSVIWPLRHWIWIPGKWAPGLPPEHWHRGLQRPNRFQPLVPWIPPAHAWGGALGPWALAFHMPSHPSGFPQLGAWDLQPGTGSGWSRPQARNLPSGVDARPRFRMFEVQHEVGANRLGPSAAKLGPSPCSINRRQYRRHDSALRA